MRFLHTADWQWGMPARFLKNADSRARYADARLAAVRAIGDVARREGCEFVLVCGDVYDANQLSRSTVLRTLDVLGSIDVPVYLLPGNHDPYEPGSIYRTPELGELPERVHILGEPGIHRVSEHVELVAAPWLTKRPVEDLVGAQLRSLAPAQGRLVRIVAGHGAVDTFSPDRDIPYLIRMDELRAAVADRRVQYVALGDRHSSTDVGVEGRVWYSGTPEVTDYDEGRPGYVLVVDVDDQHCSVTEHQVGVWTFSDVEAELSGASDVADLDTRLGSVSAKATTAVRLALRGTLGLTDYTRLEQLMERYAHVFANLATWERRTDLAILPADGESGDLGLSGYAAAAFAELEHAAAQGGPGAEDAQGALLLFHRLAGGNR